jgi:hypothetical protein
MLTLTYSVAEILFPRLATRMSGFHLFVLGSAVAGLMAAFTWVMNLVVALGRYQQPSDRAYRFLIPSPLPTWRHRVSSESEPSSGRKFAFRTPVNGLS